MLFCTDLENIIFSRHNLFEADELIIISGYVGPTPIKKTLELPLKCTVIYGMYGNNSISRKLHDTLLTLEYEIPNLSILYSNVPIHSKCYVWKNKNKIVHALIGSANFSTSGLTIPFKETLAETTIDTFFQLNNYIDQILNSCISCKDLESNKSTKLTTLTNDKNNSCEMVLFDPKKNSVQNSGGLNWGHSKGHTSNNDGYIPIRIAYIKEFPQLFPPKQSTPTKTNGGRLNRQNDSIELIWDDGTLMQGLLEGSQIVNGIAHPKNLASFPSKNILGSYLRKRLKVPDNCKITMSDLENYGRTSITVTLLEPGTYYLDFSV